MSILPNANFPLLESDQAEIIEIFNGLLRELYDSGGLMEAPFNRVMKPFGGSNDPGLERGADLQS
jgi:hypothetical protein